MTTDELIQELLPFVKEDSRTEFSEAVESITKRKAFRSTNGEFTKSVFANDAHLEQLLKDVSDYTGISIENLKSKNRDRPYVYARNLFCFAAKAIYQHVGTTAIGRIINRDHATVLHSLRMANDFIYTGDPFAEAISEFANQMGSDRFLTKIAIAKKVE
jgi:chromosomal replication initiation ATPase DnaA